MKPDLPTEFLQLLGYALCEHRGGLEFFLLYDPPRWFQEVWGREAACGDILALAGRWPFLEAFLSEAEGHWDSHSEALLASGAWMEKDALGREIPLEARAWCVEGRRILSIQNPQEEFQNRTRVLQTARDSLLVHERLLKEIQSKEILLHCIIHDLSQPLSAMRGCFDVLARESGTPGLRRLIELGRQQSERQDSMIREILQAFAADINSARGVGDVAQASPDLLACAEETVAAFGPVLGSQGASIRLDPQVDRRVPWNVNGERSRLVRVFSNLIENAVRHAPKGSMVTVGLKDDGGYVKACVEDEGPGLPKEFNPSDAFALLSKGKQGGGKAGLGLYFCRITVERWGGSIGCESLPDRGARFWFRLPRSAQTSPATDSLLPEPAASGQEGLRILLAEDDPAIRELTGVLLEREGHRVTMVGSGLQALRALSKERFDVVLLDEEMPGKGGVEVTKEIRTREAPDARHQIIFALTGNAAEGDRERLISAGFDACLGKPFRTQELRQISARFSLGEPAAPPRESGESPVGASGSSSLLARVGGDAKLLRGIARTFLKDYPAKLRKIKRAIARKDGSGLASATHALKGAVAIFGAEEAVEDARDLEQMGRQGDLAMAMGIYRKLHKAIARLDTKLREYASPVSQNSSRSGRGKRATRTSRHRRRRRPRG
jgi:signal transduction histidine kinase/CheY-like chemotaxis protein